MVSERSPSIPRRAPPGGLALSLLGMTVVPAPVPGASGDLAVLQRLRRARAAGVTTFDVAGSAEPARAERLLGQAFPEPDPDLVVIVGRRLEDLVRRDDRDRKDPLGGDGARDRLLRSLEDSRHRLSPLAIRLVEWTGEVPEDLSSNDALGADGSAPRFVHRIGSGAPPPSSQEPSRGAQWFSGPLSLLDAARAGPLEALARERPVAFLARDVMAGGRLDGTHGTTSMVDRGPGAEPPRLRDLEVEFAPVLRLAYLTERRTRTLGQAAVQFATHWPWVASALVPLPTADRLDEILGSFTADPLSEAELAQVPRRVGHRPGG
jgi:aryl-alcohol dehydrogenase-like predicted oxidoreductase